MRSVTWFFYLAALVASEEAANELFFLPAKPSPGLREGADQLSPLDSDPGLLKKEANELRAECVKMIGEIYQNVGVYSAEKIQELKDAVETKMMIAIKTAAEYLSKTSGTERAVQSDPAPVGLDRVISPSVTQLGIFSITGRVPELTPKSINWQDVSDINVAAAPTDSAVVELSDSLWAAIPLETRMDMVHKYFTAKDEALDDAWKALQKILSAVYPGQTINPDTIKDYINAHIINTDGFLGVRRRLEETSEEQALFPVDGIPVDSSALYFRTQWFYNTLYSQNVKTAKSLTPRTLLSWLDSMTRTGLVWVDGASEITLDKVWDFLIESRGTAIPSQETTATADSYNEAFWFKGIVTSQMTRKQHILGYSLYQVQIRAQLDAHSSPAEAHGVWPWLTNQQMVEMVKQYVIDEGINASTEPANEYHSVESDISRDYIVAGISQNGGLSISEELSQVAEASKSSEAYRAAIELLTAGMPVELMRDLSADDLEKLKLTYNSMMSERSLNLEQGKVQTRGLWPWISWPDLVNMAKPKPSSTATATRKRNTLIAVEQLVLEKGAPGIWAGKLKSTTVDPTGNDAPKVEVMVDAVDQGDVSDQSPESRFAKKHTELLERKKLMKEASFKQMASEQVPALSATMTLPAEIKAKVAEANARFSDAQKGTLLRPSAPKNLADVQDKNTDSSALSSVANLRGASNQRDSSFSSVELFPSLKEQKTAPSGGVDLSEVLAQLHTLDSLLDSL